MQLQETARVTLTPLDIGIFVASIVLVMGVGLWTGRKEKDTKDFFLAGRAVPWWGVAGSIFGTNVSAAQLVGMMGIGYSIGFAQSHFELGAIFALMLLAYVFFPLYRRMGLYTLSEYLGHRYDERARVAYSIISLMAIGLIYMVMGFYIGSRSMLFLLRGTPLEVSYTTGILIFALVTTCYTIAGGTEGGHLDRRDPVRAIAAGGSLGDFSCFRPTGSRRVSRLDGQGCRLAASRPKVPSLLADEPPRNSLDRRLHGDDDQALLLLGE